MTEMMMTVAARLRPALHALKTRRQLTAALLQVLHALKTGRQLILSMTAAPLQLLRTQLRQQSKAALLQLLHAQLRQCPLNQGSAQQAPAQHCL